MYAFLFIRFFSYGNHDALNAFGINIYNFKNIIPAFDFFSFSRDLAFKLKDEASGKLKKMGVEGEKAGTRTEKSLKKVEVQADKSKRSVIELGEGGKKAAGIAGSAFASMGAGVAVATANMDSQTPMVGPVSAPPTRSSLALPSSSARQVAPT